MAADSPKPPEGFEKSTPSGPDEEEDVPTVNGDERLDAGTVLQGLVLDVVEGETSSGDWYRLRIKDDARGVIDYFAKGDVKLECRAGKVEVGEPIWIGVGTEEQSFTNDDGEEVTYFPTGVAFPTGDA